MNQMRNSELRTNRIYLGIITLLIAGHLFRDVFGTEENSQSTVRSLQTPKVKDDGGKGKLESYGAMPIPGFPYQIDLTISNEDRQRGHIKLCLYNLKTLATRDGGKTTYVTTVTSFCRANSDGSCPLPSEAIFRSDFRSEITHPAKIKGYDRVMKPKTEIDRNIRDELDNYIWVEFLIDKRTGKWKRFRTDQPKEIDKYLKN